MLFFLIKIAYYNIEVVKIFLCKGENVKMRKTTDTKLIIGNYNDDEEDLVLIEHKIHIVNSTSDESSKNHN